MLVCNMVAANDDCESMYFGMACLVDIPKELWHREVWAESVLCCSGHFAFFNDGNLVFPSDCIIYSCLTHATSCRSGSVHYGHVRCIYIDDRMESLTNDQKVCIIEPIIFAATMAPPYINIIPNDYKNANNMILIEDGLQTISTDLLISPLVDIRFDNATSPLVTEQTLVVNYILISKKLHLRQFQLSTPITAELEINYFG